MRQSNLFTMQTHSDASINSGREKRGFTMVELIVVIAIIAIIGAFAFIFSMQVMKDMQQKELDETAREIFIAAQNHLSTAEAEGLLVKKSNGGYRLDPGDSQKVELEGGSSTDPGSIYLFAVNNGNRSTLNDSTSLLSEMLPVGSIDETVRSGYTFVIRYDIESATVMDVFCGRSSYQTLFGASSLSFNGDDDYVPLFKNPDYTGESSEAKASRQNYKGTGKIIGYYGAASGSVLSGDVGTLQLSVTNAEKLFATVTYKPGNEANGLDPIIRLVVTGKESGLSKTLILRKNTGSSLTEDASTKVSTDDKPISSSVTEYVYTTILDDITSDGNHFAQRFSSSDTHESKGLIPGEDIEIQAFISSTTGLAKVGKSVKITRNSLFSSLEKDNSAQATAVNVSNIRHLENLSKDISGYKDGTGDSSTWSGPTVVRQTSDMSWKTFQEEIAKANAAAGFTPTDKDKVTTLSLKGTKLVDDGSFMPITPGFEINYDGSYALGELQGTYRISDVVINRTGEGHTGDAGLFASAEGTRTTAQDGTVTNTARIANIQIVNLKANTSSGNAGALAGLLDAVDVSGVAAFNEVANDAAYEIAGSGSVGGLVGSMTDGSIKLSAAALYVKSTNGSAGGLIGSVSGSVQIEQSYTGGHTNGDIENNHVDNYGFTEAKDASAGRINVLAGGSGYAGGLVGDALEATSLTANQCYSTASVFAPTAVGGLVGALGSGGITNSYTAGLVSAPDDVSKGFFVGATKDDAVLTMNNNQYISMLNDASGMNPIGKDSASAADADLDSYRAFAPSTAGAFPYDSWLKTHYNVKYPFKTISLLGGSAIPSLPHLTQHYGDWPALETFVINTSNSTSNG